MGHEKLQIELGLLLLARGDEIEESVLPVVAEEEIKEDVAEVILPIEEDLSGKFYSFIPEVTNTDKPTKLAKLCSELLVVNELLAKAADRPSSDKVAKQV